MTLEFLVFANLTLLARLLSLFRDDAAVAWVWAAKAGFELLALGALYEPGRAWLGAAAVVLVLNAAGALWDRRAGRRNMGRLLLGLAGLVALSGCFSPAAGLGFRPGLARAGEVLRDWTALRPFGQVLVGVRFHLVLFGLLVAANEANLFIRAAFDWLNLKPQMRAGAPGTMELDVGEYNRGRVIGLLERALIYFFVLNGQFGVIGFTLAAKAFTRFKELDDRRFAEYVLIGTLLSSCLAVGTGAVVKWLLSR
ncbi:MAG: hypothetical protein HYV75_06855 [Opitutae bacterium]|nr:hypothetical protein [Opitutae bacterium]